MIEAAGRPGREIAEVAEFFSFGTNDLTQTAFRFSRDDIGKFLGLYEERKLVPANPFVTVDVLGVGRLMQIACEVRQTAGPEAGDLRRQRRRPRLGRFCHTLGLDYVSCSPFRVRRPPGRRPGRPRPTTTPQVSQGRSHDKNLS